MSERQKEEECEGMNETEDSMLEKQTQNEERTLGVSVRFLYVYVKMRRTRGVCGNNAIHIGK